MLLFNTPQKVIIFLLLPMVLLGCDTQMKVENNQPAAIHVDTLTIAASTIRLKNELPGRISAFKEAEVRPQVSGIVQSREFQEGSMVNRGDILYKIDPTTYQAVVNSAKAQLDKALASEESTKKVSVRYEELLKKSLSSQQLASKSGSRNQTSGS